MTDEQIWVVCDEWARGQHFPVDQLDERQLVAAMSADPARWWNVLRGVIDDSPTYEYAENLSWVLAPLVSVRSGTWPAVLVEETRAIYKAVAVVAYAFDHLHDRVGKARMDRLRAYELLGRDLVVSTWLRHMAEGANSDRDFWPFFLVKELIERNPEEAWTTIVQMIETASLREASHLGAGFLEDLLGGRLGDEWIDRIEEQARRSEKFRAALAALWIDGDVAPDTFLRIERAAGAKLDRADRQ